jgi:hypothetical protein
MISREESLISRERTRSASTGWTAAQRSGSMVMLYAGRKKSPAYRYNYSLEVGRGGVIVKYVKAVERSDGCNIFIDKTYTPNKREPGLS